LRKTLRRFTPFPGSDVHKIFRGHIALYARKISA
jgi:hypothetical protein